MFTPLFEFADLIGCYFAGSLSQFFFVVILDAEVGEKDAEKLN
jgi:hypothetical protein